MTAAHKEQYVGHSLEMRLSPAWRALPNHSRRALDFLEQKHMKARGGANGRLTAEYSDLAPFGIPRAAIKRALTDAISLGFLEMTRQGGLTSGDVHLTSLFRLTYVNNAGTLMPTHEWRQIVDGAAAKAALKEGRRQIEAARKKKLELRAASHLGAR